MSWNYRVIEFVAPSLETWRAIHEVHYDDAGRPMQYSETPASVTWSEGEDESTPAAIMDRMREALNKPTLTQFDFMNSFEEALGEVVAEIVETEGER